MSTIRAAVIGVGYLGRFHAMKYRELAEVELVAVVDAKEDRARNVGREMDAEAYLHHRELLGRVDLATVAVPTTEHYSVAKELLQNGIHVLVEKPLAASLEQAEDLVATAEASSALLQVGHLERFNPAVQALKVRLDRPLFLECQRISPYPARGADVDVVLDLMIHDIDLLLDFIRSDLVGIEAIGVPVLTPRYDIVNARLRFGEGCVANITASRVSAKSLRKIRVFQPDAYLSADCNKGEPMTYRKMPADGSGQLPKIVGDRLELEERDTLLEEVRSFVDAVRQGKDPVVDGTAGFRCLEVALAVIQKIEENFPKELLVDLQGRLRDV